MLLLMVVGLEDPRPGADGLLVMLLLEVRVMMGLIGGGGGRGFEGGDVDGFVMVGGEGESRRLVAGDVLSEVADASPVSRVDLIPVRHVMNAAAAAAAPTAGRIA